MTYFIRADCNSSLYHTDLNCKLLRPPGKKFLRFNDKYVLIDVPSGSIGMTDDVSHEINRGEKRQLCRLCVK